MPTGERDLPSWDEDRDVDPELDPDEELEAEIEHADRPLGADRYGVTADEEARGEPLDLRLAEERPERPTEDLDLEIEDDGMVDEEKELVGRASVVRDPFVAPEEAAMGIRERPPGVVDHAEEPEVNDD